MVVGTPADELSSAEKEKVSTFQTNPPNPLLMTVHPSSKKKNTPFKNPTSLNGSPVALTPSSFPLHPGWGINRSSGCRAASGSAIRRCSTYSIMQLSLLPSGKRMGSLIIPLLELMMSGRAMRRGMKRIALIMISVCSFLPSAYFYLLRYCPGRPGEVGFKTEHKLVWIVTNDCR